MNNYLEINSLTNPKIIELCNLQKKQERFLRQLFLVEGHHLIAEAQQHGYLEYILTTSTNDFVKYQTTGYLVNSKIINKLSTTVNSQEIIGVCKMLETTNCLDKYQKIVILDNINDPGNLGTIIRTCAALGVEAIIMSLETVDIYNDKVIRATQGALFKIPLIKMSLEEAIKELQKQEIMILATSLEAKKELADLSVYENFAIIFGNEANGIRKEILTLADETFILPMQNGVESLNVGVACGIIVYNLIKKIGGECLE